ncbi:MAG: hypothetical protein F7B17_07235 [Desulfurococcales archaeon]|nr:hypothetical protein [Desulfurococcales archaeon]
MAFSPEDLAEESLKAIREEVNRRVEMAKGRINDAYSRAVRRVETSYREAAKRFSEKVLRG